MIALRIFLLVGACCTTVSGAAAADDTPVLTYHGEPDRSGTFVVPRLTRDHAKTLHLDTRFHAEFSGHLYAQPLYWHGMLIAATENDGVDALNAITGSTIWHRALGTPATRADLPCGNISPLGITGTPVIDETAQAIYLDAMVQTSTGPRHRIFALALNDGSPLPGWPVDVGDALQAKHRVFVPRDQNQRGALTIIGGRVYVPFGGHWGDCGQYHGWIVGVALKNPRDVIAWSTRARGGGIWAPGGIGSDRNSLYFATGNTFDAKAWSDGEAVFRLSAELSPLIRKQDYFAPMDWEALDESDSDIGGSNPMLVDVPTRNGLKRFIVQLGKDRRAYLLDRDNLRGIGGALAVQTVATDAIRTAPAAYRSGDTVLVAFQAQGAQCPNASGTDGLTVLRIGVDPKPSMTTAWCAPLNGRGSPIVTTTDGHSNSIVWIVGAEGDNRLHGFNGDSGELLFTGGGAQEVMTGLHHFQTLIVGSDRLYVGADGRIYSFVF